MPKNIKTSNNLGSRLMRIIAPKIGEPADVRCLYYANSKSRINTLTRTSFVIAENTEVSFEAYFNAFPAAYWRRWTPVRNVVCVVEASGVGRVELHRSKSDGSRIAVKGADISGQKVRVEIPADLGPFEDGGWLWCDITSQSELTIHSASWYSAQNEPVRSENTSITIGFPTFNRPEYATATLKELAIDDQLTEHIEEIIVVDQGNQKMQEHPDFQTNSKFWDKSKKLKIINQGNFGGSGGYSRILFEYLKANTKTQYLIFMDDDLEIEPECILRSVMFAKHTSNPMLVGAQMLNLQERSHLHTMGEVIDRANFMWTAASPLDYDFDFSKYSFRDRENSHELHRRVDVEFNGWWTCLIPKEIAAVNGQPLPLFLKWDDAEYGLRAFANGFSTVTLPGFAVWHMAWTDKDDAIDWQAYFHLRNRLVVAALYHNGGFNGIYFNTMKALLKHLLCLEYSTIVIQMEAIRDFLAGPTNLFELLPSALGKVAQIRQGFPDSTLLPSAAVLPKTSGTHTAFGKIEPKGAVAKLKILFIDIWVNLRKVNPINHEVPQANFTPLEARWYSLGRADGVTVTAADARGVYYRKRDRKLMFKLLKESSIIHWKLRRQFKQKQKQYRQYHAELISTQAWERFFNEN